tara:strand:- start:1099 stop:1305 length:207 start_codon:yes stop_codon:yes gene_type:complete
MVKYYTTENLIEEIKSIQGGYTYNTEILNIIAVRLETLQEHLQWSTDRVALAEKVIGEMCLQERESRV